MSEHIKTELSGTSQPLIGPEPRLPLAQTHGGFCCPKCGKPFRETMNEATYPDWTEASGVVYTPACNCRVPVWWTPERKP